MIYSINTYRLLLILKEVHTMMYKFLTLNDNSEIVHSEMQPDGSVKVYIEKPDPDLCFRHATCYLPSYQWEDIVGFTDSDIDYYQDVISSTAHLIMEFSRNGGFEFKYYANYCSQKQ